MTNYFTDHVYPFFYALLPHSSATLVAQACKFWDLTAHCGAVQLNVHVHVQLRVDGERVVEVKP